MANFVNDYSGLAAAGAGFQSFADAFERAKDSQAKRQEMEARMSAEKAKAERDADEAAIKMKVAGLRKNASGEMEDAPMGPGAQGKQKLDVFKAGGNGEYDENGNLTNVTVNPDSMNMLRAQSLSDQRDSTRNFQQRRIGLQEARFGEQQSQNAAHAGHQIESDSVMKDMVNARQSLSRGRGLLDGKNPLTYNNLSAVQMDVIAGMTKGGQTSEGKVNREMQESWIGKWNNAMAKAGKYGEGNDIRTQDPGLYNQIKGLLEEVDHSIANNMSDRTKALASSYSQTSNKKVRATVDQKVKQYSAPEEPQGLVSGQGLVKPGLVNGEGGAPQQDPNVIDYAKQNNLDYAHALKILMDRGYGK